MRRWLSLDWLFVLRILPVSLLIAVALSGFQAWQLQANFTRELEYKESELLRIGAALLASPMWNMDETSIQALVDVLYADDDVTSVQILDSSGNVVYASQGSKSSLQPLWRSAPIVFNDDYRARETGEIRLAFSREQLGESIKAAVLNIFLAVGLMVLLITWLSLRFHYRHVITPLNAILSAMRHLRSGEGFRPISTRAAGEVGDALRAFNTLGVQLDEAQREIDYQTRHDRLTQLYNRTGLSEALDEWIATQPQRGLGLLQLDINHFRWINESYGQQAGNALLVDIAERLKQSALQSNASLLTRLGGDEFVITFADADASTLANQAAQLREALQAPFFIGQEELFVSFTMGGALYPRHAHTTESLVKALVLAVQNVKSIGRGQYRLYQHSASRLPASDMIILERDLHHALSEGHLRLAFQPIFGVDLGKVVGAEALLRMVHPQRGMISPATFIPVAEESGLIVPIGQWVVDQGLAWLKRMDAQGHNELTLSFNVSARQLHAGGFVEALRRSLKVHDVPAERIILEMTENLMLNPEPAILEQFAALRALGCRLAIDDFGTGYSSLSYLQKLPFDIIKIDRSFVQGGPKDERHALLASAIIEMGHALGLSVTVEGIETSDQASRFIAMSADHLQGFHYARPQDGENFAHLLTVQPTQQSSPPTF
ncbi:diguanylate cyclase (GGDEF) domain-containing protein [Modicisalibacter muralis]|uniref:Diguanylate cyclase (GGDEF) domain-containing protein n=1 Tax=Modicisalibacter muralis TaxID=119000 RepID=A0A1G9GHG4_9GAMM|nr:bifunctional diguanylate cyclase/phosphodiesterase [Halomonas muralis]SDL00110.1 diguanylate cyclase (GGDEF) domain-containing protein [Halomonas muralis]